MNSAWFTREDWPLEHELERREKLIAAVRGVPGGDRLSEDDVEWHALSLWRDSLLGYNEEMPRNKPASQQKSENELRKLADSAEKLSSHIGRMHQPAISALFAEGCQNIFRLQRDLGLVSELAHQALPELDVNESAMGAGRKIQAAYVAEKAAMIFEFVGCKRPTYTTDPQTNEVSGDWPEFLARVFSALWIKASVPAQIKALSQKSAAE